jgi:hypothetical protein
MEAICSSEMLVYFQRTIRRYIPEYKTLYVNFCVEEIYYENSFCVKMTTARKFVLKFYKFNAAAMYTSGNYTQNIFAKLCNYTVHITAIFFLV